VIDQRRHEHFSLSIKKKGGFWKREREKEREGMAEEKSEGVEKETMSPWEQHAAVINLPRFDYNAPSSLLRNSHSGFLITCTLSSVTFPLSSFLIHSLFLFIWVIFYFSLQSERRAQQKKQSPSFVRSLLLLFLPENNLIT